MAPKLKIEASSDELDDAQERAPCKRALNDDEDGRETPPAQQQPSTKRPARTPLNFSIESIMQPSRQQVSHSNNNNNNNNNLSHQDKRAAPNVSRSPSPSSDVDSSGAESSASTLASRASENGGRDAKRRDQQHQLRHANLNDLHLNLNTLVNNSNNNNNNNNNDAESFVSSNSSRNSSRVSSPISPGCNSNAGNQQHDNRHHQHHHMNHHHQSNRNTHLKHSSSNQHKHHHHHHTNENHHGHQQRGPLPNGPSPMQAAGSPPYMSHSSSRPQGQHASTSASSAYASANHSTGGPTSTSGSTGRLNQVECVLDNKDMWDKFHSLNTEMIITKTGRRMFPVLKVQFHNLDPSARYAVSMDIVPVDNKRYRYAYHKSCWQVAGKADPSAEPRLYPHPDSPFNGDLLSRQVISFEKVKLTNNEMDKSGHIILNSMHKYQPRVHLIELKSTLVVPPPQQTQQMNPMNGKMGTSRYAHQQQQQQQRSQPQAQLDIEGYRTFVFPETVFTAVTAYQNQLITKMKIDKNPFAKGFRDSSRLSDLDRNDPFEGFMSLGPAAAAAAAACAVGRFPQGPGGPGPVGMPPGSLEAAAAAAGMQPGNPGQMDQAYAQLLASAAAANSPWYSAAAAAAANASPFGSIGPSTAAACSTAQAAQQLQATQMWLAAFSACLNNGGQPLGPLPPPPGGPMPGHEQLDPSGQLQDCRGDSRASG